MPEFAEDYSSDEDRQLSKKELQEIERKRLKNKKKKESKKKRGQKTEVTETKQNGDVKPVANDENDAPNEVGEVKKEEDDIEDDLAVEIEYVGEIPILDEKDPNFQYFTSVFDAFKVSDGETERFPISSGKYDEAKKDVESRYSMVETQADDAPEKMSRRKLRVAMQPSIAKLKESTYRPDVVEWADVTSRDPFLLVAMKAYRNTVPVPRHWNAKRKYLAGKRGLERQPFQLPDFIRRTGIQDLREAMWEKEEHSSLKSKMRAMARPKLGKIDIDYQKLHDAFFKWQTKPCMTMMGELYYEGKEQEALMRDKKPGQLSDNLRIALGMPVGPTAHKFPPPWLIAMQRYGPPPSYPNIKIPGLSAPIPEGCAFGYHAGGWGKPPVDEYGKPMYGDVFGVEQSSSLEPEDESRIERRYWGEIGSDEESDVESEIEEDEEPIPEKIIADGMTTPMVEGLVTPSGMTTGITGLETPETIELRKGKRVDESLAGVDTPAAAAYHIIPEKKSDRIGNAMMGSTHVYDLSKKQAVNEDGVQISLDPSEVDLDPTRLQEKYDEQLRKQTRSNDDQEDLADMVAVHSAKQNRKRKAQEQKKQPSGSSSSKPEKKYKDFKF